MTKKIVSIALTILAFSCIVSFSATAKSFKDVPKNYWAKMYVDKMTASGYFKGYPDNTFKPNNNITRLEFMVTLSRVMSNLYKENIGLAQSDLDEAYVDSEVKNIKWALNDYKKIAAYLHIFNGYRRTDELGKEAIMGTFGRNFMPSKNITRAEVVAMLYNFYDRSNISVKESSLNDISEHKFKTQIEAAETLGILSGYPDKSFKPDKGITRAEASKILNIFISKKSQLQNVTYDMTDSVRRNYEEFLTPTQVINTVLTLEQNGDYETAYKYYSKAAKKSKGYNSYFDYMAVKSEQVSYNMQTYDPNSLEYKEIREGDKVKVYFRAYDKNSKIVQAIEAKELVLEEGKWYIDFNSIPVVVNEW